MARASVELSNSHTEQGQHFWLTDYARGDVFGAAPTLIEDRWIYVLDRRDDSPVKLHLEICADHKGKLSQVPGDVRRRRETTASDVKPLPVDTVSFPTCIQGHDVRYFFFASPTRLCKRGIAALENAMAAPSAEWFDLRTPPNGRIFFNPKRPPLLVVIDPLTIAVKLHSAYEVALDGKLHYVMPSEATTDKQAETIRARVLKYQLAQLITRHLLPDRQDPFNVRKELADRMGDEVFAYVEHFDATVAALEAQVDGTAALLIQHFKSPHWELLGRLHLFSARDTAAWLNFVAPCIDRLNSCRRGIEYFGGIFDKPPKWLGPAGLALEGEERDYEDAAALVARKSAAGVVAVWAEIFPSAIVLKKISTVKALERIDIVREFVKVPRKGKPLLFDGGLIVHGSREVPVYAFRRVDTKELHAEMLQIKEWTKEVEGRWAEESEGALTAKTVTKALQVIEVLNLLAKLNKIADPNNENHLEAGCDLAGAVLDTSVAYEGSLKSVFEDVLHSERLAGASLKFLGALSSLIDVALIGHKMVEANREGKTDLIMPYMVGLGAASAGVVGGIVHIGVALSGAGDALTISLGLAASALCFAALSATMVLSLYQEGKKRSPFQRFINHSVFGLKDDPREAAEWVRGETFARWNNTPEGLFLQIQTVSFLFASFKVTGHDQSTVDIQLGAVPPGAKLEIAFIHGDQADSSGPSHRTPLRAKALIDLFASTSAEALLRFEGEVIWQVRLTQSAQGPSAVRIGARPKEDRGVDPLRYCVCEARLIFMSQDPERYASQLLSIPTKEPMRYYVVQGAAVVNREPKSSLPEAD
jgi:hypothetical protein